MPHVVTSVMGTLCALAVVAMIACGEVLRAGVPQPIPPAEGAAAKPPADVASETIPASERLIEQSREADAAERTSEDPAANIRLRVRLHSLKQDHPWAETSAFGHDRGTAPLAEFVIVEPTELAGHTFSVLFKHAVGADTPPPRQPDIGQHFTLTIPRDSLAIASVVLDNLDVVSLERVKQ